MTPPSAAAAPPTGSAPSDPLLVVDGLRTWFDGPGGPARAVDDVSFRVGAGESVGLVGESGCGKTVTCLSLLGLVPEPGRIIPGSSVRLDGEELVGAPSSVLRRVRGRRIGMVFQEPATALNPVIPVGEQVAEVVRTHLGGGRRAARARAVELLAEVGLAAPAEGARAYPHQLSGGQRQRVVIAGALAAEPDLLVADEPTTALDVTVQARIVELLDGLRRKRGMALLFVSHDLAVVSEICERVLVMYAGEIVERVPVSAAFDEPAHPYTRALLEATPRRGAPGPTGIPGRVPSPRAWPPGCRFEARCPWSWERCRTQHPPLLETAPAEEGREMRHGGAPAARCWLVEEPERREEAS